MTITNNVAAKLVVAFVASAMLVSLAFAPVANAQTNEELQAQIAALLAQIAALQSQIGGGSSSASYTFTRDLTVGATGEDVRQLQVFLNANGYVVASTGAGSAGMESTYFGGLTKAALAKYQAAEGISPAVGYFGPITRAAVHADMGGTTGGGSTDGGSTGGLEGGAGSISDADYLSGLNNEEVGEGEEDVEVAGLDIEADGSDIEITAVNLNFSQGSGASRDFDRYADEVSIWFDGEEVARLDADEFEDDDNFDKTVSLDRGAIVRDGDTGELVVAVSGINNLDSSDAGDEWTVEFESVRFRDAQGAVVSDTTTGDINDATGRTFSFETFTTAADVELKITSGEDDINDARVIEVDASTDTDNVELFSFELEAEGESDITLDDVPMLFTATGDGAPQIDELANAVQLVIDGEVVDSMSVPSSATTVSLLTFDNIDYTIGAGETVEVIVRADLNNLDGSTFQAGNTLMVEFGEDETDNTGFNAEDEEGNDLEDNDVTGSASSDAHSFYTVGPNVALVSVSQSASTQDSANNDTATFKIVYDVTAFGGDIWVSDTATATTATTPVAGTSGVFYRVDHAGTATVAGLSSTVTFVSATGITDAGSDGIKINEGKTARFTLTTTRTNTSANGTAALFRMALEGIAWEDSAAGANEFVYTFSLEDFETDYIFIN